MPERASTAAAIRAEVFEDDDLSQSLKLFILAALHVYETAPARKKLKTFKREHWAYRALRCAGYSGTVEELSSPLRWLIHDDVPKYRADMTVEPPCSGTMLRPLGAPCKRKVTQWSSKPHPITGERTMIGACSDRRHAETYRAEHKAAWQAWRDNGEPAPKPNSGGKLLRYFTTGIEPLYAWADKDYQAGTTVPEAPVMPLAPVISILDRRGRDE